VALAAMTAYEDAFAALRARGAPADVLARLAATGLPGRAACDAVAAASLAHRLRVRFSPQARLSRVENARLAAIAALADDVLEMEGNPESAHRFWTGPMPWLGGRTPAETLAGRNGTGVVDDLVNRLKHGIPP
jgi:putative toxin-antitoxin system antitoxin component (TIGR02293 family)